jgi:hypothetical protein
MKILMTIMLLVCGQAMAQKNRYDVPVNITLKGADTTKTMLFKLKSLSDTTAEVYFESMTYLQNTFYLIVFTFPDNSHIELFIETSDTSTDPVDIVVNKNALVTRNVLYDKTTGSYYYKEEPRSKIFFEGTKKLSW